MNFHRTRIRTATAARKLGVTPGSVRKMVASGKLEGGSEYVYEDSLEGLLKKRQAAKEEAPKAEKWDEGEYVPPVNYTKEEKKKLEHMVQTHTLGKRSTRHHD